MEFFLFFFFLDITRGIVGTQRNCETAQRRSVLIWYITSSVQSHSHQTHLALHHHHHQWFNCQCLACTHIKFHCYNTATVTATATVVIYQSVNTI
eukprot:jgi/Chrzof1/2412/Cz11g14130.t1